MLPHLHPLDLSRPLVQLHCHTVPEKYSTSNHKQNVESNKNHDAKQLHRTRRNNYNVAFFGRQTYRSHDGSLRWRLCDNHGPDHRLWKLHRLVADQKEESDGSSRA